MINSLLFGFNVDKEAKSITKRREFAADLSRYNRLQYLSPRMGYPVFPAGICSLSG